ncbi:MAG: ATP-binding protein [Candidatus Scalindua sp.]
MNDLSTKSELEVLQETVRFFEELINTTADGILITDSAQNIIKANETFCNIFGCSRNELLETNLFMWLEQLDSDAVSQWTELEKKVFHKGFCHNVELQMTTTIGVKRHFSVNASRSKQVIINDTGGIISIWHDITERKQMENELNELNESLEQRVAERTDELAQANEELIKAQKLESVGVLAGGIAHDFNNSLQAILGYITLAELHASSNNEIHEYLEEARKVILKSKGLTQQLLTFSKGGEPVKSTIFISKLIGDSAMLALSGSNVRCVLGIPDGLWPVEADKGQLNQVISNLIINADQAMPEGGNIKVWAENINVVEKDPLPLQEGRYVKITIEDHGTGISQEHLQKVFDPYFTTKKNGNGLGLATTYSIVKKHDGHITIESKIGVGTTFHIYLPASRKKTQKELALSEAEGSDNKHLEKKAEKACSEPVNGISPELAEEKDEEEKLTACKGKVLIMDDEYVIRTILSKQLRHLKYEVEAAEEGAEAIRLYERASRTGKPFDVVVMDLTISGGMGGKEAIKRLLEIDPEVKAIVVSGYANDPIMANYKKYGFSSVLPKPHEIDELDETLQKVMMAGN